MKQLQSDVLEQPSTEKGAGRSYYIVGKSQANGANADVDSSTNDAPNKPGRTEGWGVTLVNLEISDRDGETEELAIVSTFRSKARHWSKCMRCRRGPYLKPNST